MSIVALKNTVCSASGLMIDLSEAETSSSGIHSDDGQNRAQGQLVAGVHDLASNSAGVLPEIAARR